MASAVEAAQLSEMSDGWNNKLQGKKLQIICIFSMQIWPVTFELVQG